MNKFLLLALLPLTLVAGTKRSYFAFEAGYLLMDRSSKGGQNLVEIEKKNSVSDDEKISFFHSKQLKGKTYLKGGLSGTFQIFCNPYLTLECNYTRGLDWEVKKTLSHEEGLSFPNISDIIEDKDNTDYLFADKVEASYRSTLRHAQFNILYHVTPRYIDYFSVSSLVGFRCFETKDKLNLSFTKSNQESFLMVRTFNRTFGPQVGMSFEYNPSQIFTWGFHLKGGGCFNNGMKANQVKDRNNEQKLSQGYLKSRNIAGFIDFFPFIEFRPLRALTFTLGYQGLYINGIALADGQNFFKVDAINRRGEAFYRGAFGSCRINF